MRRMRIGEFAVAAGVSVDAVRFYERRGVLRPAPRTAGGYRTFDERDLDRVRLARQLQQPRPDGRPRWSTRWPRTTSAVRPAPRSGGGSSRSRPGSRPRWRSCGEPAALIRDALAACDAGHCRLATASPEA